MKHPIMTRMAAYGFRTGMLVAAVSIVAVLVFGSPQTLKTSLRQSGAYDTAARNLATKASDAATAQLGQTVDKQTLDKTASDTITAQSLQDAAEKNIDTSYDWLEGRTDKPDIRLDLTPYVSTFTDKLGDQAVQHTEGLPACTLQQARQLAIQAGQSGSVDVMDLPCLPPGVDVSVAKDAAISRARQSNDFLRDPVLTLDSLPKDADGRTVVDQASYVPTVYQWLKLTPWIAGGLALMCLLLVVRLYWPDWQGSVRRLARSLLGVGIVLAIVAGLSRLSFMYVSRPGGIAGKLAGGEYRDVIVAFMTSLEKAVDLKLLAFGVGYVVVGVIGLVVARMMQPDASENINTSVGQRDTGSMR